MRKIKPTTELQNKMQLIPKMFLRLQLFTMPILELREYLRQELERNIFLEEITFEGEKEEIEEELDLEDIFQGIADDNFPVNLKEMEDEPYKYTPVSLPSLTEHLELQIPIVFKKDRERKIAYEILSVLNNDGFIGDLPQDIAKRLGVSLKRFENVRRKFMFLDPRGVGARDIREALLIQMESLQLKDELPYILVRDYLESMCDKEGKKKLSEELNVSMEMIENSIKLIQSLNPRPGTKYSSYSASYIVPDVVVLRRGEKFIPFLVESDFPHLRINTSYLRLKKNKDLTSDEKNFLRTHLQNALDLFRALMERRNNLLRVVEFIIEHQKQFFKKGETSLRPIAQIDLAKKMGINPSTLNRLLKSKYVDTPRGIYELNYFFPGGIKKRGGRISREKVKDRIKELIEKEEFPYSDRQIAEILQGEGIKIKRRTVQKYRSEIGIPECSNREK